MSEQHGGEASTGICTAVELRPLDNIYQQRIGRLEDKLADLVRENSSLKDELEKEQILHDTHVKELQHNIEVEVQELQRRQDLVENVNPLLQRQVDAVRSQVGALSMPQSGFENLKHIPVESRSLADEVRSVMHEGMLRLKNEKEASQHAEQVAKAALQQSLEDVAHLKEEIKHLNSDSAARDAAHTCDAVEDPPQVSQLQRQLEQVTIAAEINKAKADLYDEVAKHAQTLEEELIKLRSSDTQRAESQEELGRVVNSLRDCQHKLQLATVDKEYMKRELSSFETRIKEQQAQIRALDDSLAAEKAQSQELYHKLTAVEDKGCNELQRHIDEEVTRVQQAARADIAALREESRFSLERETRLLREMCDRSQLEAERLGAELKDCRRELDGAASRYRALQHKSDASITSLAADLKIKTVDADRAHPEALQMALAERDVQLQRVEAQNDLLGEKVKVLTGSLSGKERHSNSKLRNVVAPATQSSFGGGDGTLPSCSGETDISTVDDFDHSMFGHPMGTARMQLSVVTAQCKALGCELASLRVDRDALVQKLEISTRDIHRLEAAQGASNPNTFLMQELRRAEDAAQRARQEAAVSDSALQQQAGELHDCKLQLTALQADLRAVLQQRQLLEALKRSCLQKDNSCPIGSEVQDA